MEGSVTECSIRHKLHLNLKSCHCSRMNAGSKNRVSINEAFQSLILVLADKEFKEVRDLAFIRSPNNRASMQTLDFGL